MATATEIVTKALKRINVISGSEVPDASDMSDGKDALNAMIASWDAEGLSGDTLPLDKRYEQGIIAMLAVRMAEDFGKQVGPVLARDAENGWRALQAAFITPATPTFDYALTRTPSRRYPYTVPIDGTTPWKANTTFTLGTLVANNGNIYGCIVAGTSGATGPTGTANNQTDGSCVWNYVEAIITQ